MNEYKKILLINFGGIGDEILFSPVIQSLKKHYPNSKITLCLEGRSKAYVNLTNLLDSHFCVDIKTKNKYLEMLKLYFYAIKGKYDLVISSGANPLIAILLFFTGIKTRVGYKTNKLSKKLLTHPVELNKNQYAANMYFALVKPITNGEFELPKIEIKNYEREKNTILVHPGVSAMSVAKYITKTISAEKWAELIKSLLKTNKKVILAGGPDDEDCINNIRKNLEGIDKTNLIDMYGKTKNIFDLVNLIKKSEIMICSDSAPMHIGVATETETIAIFGPTDNEKLIPKSNIFHVVKNNVECRPCLWEKRQTTCEKLECLNIDLNEIIEIIK